MRPILIGIIVGVVLGFALPTPSEMRAGWVKECEVRQMWRTAEGGIGKDMTCTWRRDK